MGEFQPTAVENKDSPPEPTWKCDHSSHPDQTYITHDIADLDAHLNDGNHTKSGSSACAICGKENVTYQPEAIMTKKPVCDDCKEDLRK